MEKKIISIPFNLIERKTVIIDGEEYFTFKGYASTFGNKDLGYDIIINGAFLNSLKKRKPKLLWQHDMKEPIGTFSQIYEDEKGLFVDAKMPLSDSLVSGRVMPQMKAGSVDSMSIGFSTLDSEMKEIDDEVVRVIKEVELWEISLVTIPMNPKAQVTDIKAVPYQDLPLIKSGEKIDFDRAWNAEAAIERIKEFAGAEKQPNAKFRKAFLWYDSDNADSFGSYKLPIADVVNGKMIAIPKGIYEATAAIKGARGGVDIPETDKETIKNNINKYYVKMDKESPFKSFDFETITDVSRFLKSRFTNSETDDIIYYIKKFSKKPESCNETPNNTPCNEEVKKILDSLKQLKEGVLEWKKKI